MRSTCDQCGVESDDALPSCAACGAVFEPPILPTQATAHWLPPSLPPAPPSSRSLNGATATIVLLIYLGAQFAAGIVVGLFGSVFMGMRGGKFQLYDYRDTMQAVIAWTRLPGSDFWMCRDDRGVAKTSRDLTSKIQEPYRSGVGSRFLLGREIAKGLTIGILLGLLWSVCDSLRQVRQQL